jgi:hypothetical protein
MRDFLRLIVFSLVFFSDHLAAETLVLEPQKDNTLFEDTAGRFSNGAGQYLFMGRTGGDNGVDRLLRRALLQFDLSLIPPGSQINNVELRLTIDKVAIGATGGISSVHRLLNDWGEGSSNAPGPEGQGTAAGSGDATWIHTFYAGNHWGNAGGDFNTTASQSSHFSSSPETLVFESSESLINDVETWVNKPSSNFGWIILGDEPAVQNARRFLSREHVDIQTRPNLVVEYTAPVVMVPVPASSRYSLLLLIVMVLAGLYFHRRTSHV